MAAPAVLPAAAPVRGTIELHVREPDQLFDSFDPCPFYSRDLDADAEEYIIASVGELRQPLDFIAIHIDQAGSSDDAAMIETAVHQHFARKVGHSTRDLRLLLRRGWISLAIGLAFLVGLLGVSEIVGERVTGAFGAVLHESLVIGGWVAMWRPLEIFLYDWWPIAGQRRTYARLAKVPIRVRRGT
jgi:hypothetical protein